MKKFILFLLLPVFTQGQQNDTAFIKKISDEVLQNGQAYELLHYLTKKIGGRLAGSPQYNQAVKWGVATCKSFGSDTVFLQECLVPNWKRGTGDFATLIANNSTKKSLSITAVGNALGSFKTITAPLLFVENFDELEKKKHEVKGKIVYFNAGFNPTNIRTFKSYSETGIYRGSSASRAAKYGALGVIIRSLSEATDNFPHTGAMKYNDSFPKIPAVCVGIQDADYLAANAKNNQWKISMKTHGKMLADTINHNVVAELRGTEFPEKYITIGGHLDSWDICEGAHDDGAGIVQTLEILRAFKVLGYQPKHTIRFVLFANEENGLRGGLKYAALAKDNNENHIFALESDAGGFTPRGFSFSMSKEKLAAIQHWLPLLKPYGTEFLELGGGGADIGPLYRTFGTPIAGFIPDSQRYFDVHHAPSDTFEKVNKRELLLGAVNMAALIYLVDKYGL
jgi:carboxypeptidase Q